MNKNIQENRNVRILICTTCQRCETFDFHWDGNDNFEAHIKCALLDNKIYTQNKEFDCPNFLYIFDEPSLRVFDDFILAKEMEL